MIDCHYILSVQRGIDAFNHDGIFNTVEGGDCAECLGIGMFGLAVL